MLDQILERFWQHRDRQAMARLLTIIGRDEHVDEIRAWLDARTAKGLDDANVSVGSELGSGPGCDIAPRCRVVAVTGSGGVGKSTLIGKLIEVARSRAESLAVLACDPQSSLTGGALLGDRIRMPSRPDDLGVFIRSLATPSGHEAIAPNIDLMIRLLCIFGFGTVVLETAGAGQGDTAVRRVADVVVVLVQPETGDELQWEKAGLLEVADIVVVNKADLPGADHVESQLRELLNLPGCRPVPVLRVSSSRSQGLDELWRTIESRAVRTGGA